MKQPTTASGVARLSHRALPQQRQRPRVAAPAAGARSATAGTGCWARWPTSGSASPTAPSSLVHIWPVEHRGFPVGLSRHEQEPGGGGGVGDRELLSGTQQDQLGSVCLSLRARFTQHSLASPRPTSVVIVATPSRTGGDPPIGSVSQHNAEAVLRIPGTPAV